ncbi:MAG: hypothetical protein F6K19_37085 [Cyanothece sp. SIO1E1]|nr:hypothetical protein [Cyanothece sp. SIO1E1]
MREINLDKLIRLCELEIKKGTELQTILCYLKALDISIIEAIKVIRKSKKINLGEAKSLVSSNKCWSEETEKLMQLNDDVLKRLNEEYDVKIFPDSIEISIDLNDE